MTLKLIGTELPVLLIGAFVSFLLAWVLDNPSLALIGIGFIALFIVSFLSGGKIGSFRASENTYLETPEKERRKTLCVIKGESIDAAKLVGF
jgi:hypothetical protein